MDTGAEGRRRRGGAIAARPSASWSSHRVLGAAVGLSTWAGVAVVLGGLALSWLLSIATGGAGVVVPHWFYVPVIVTAVRFGSGAALLVALVAGIVAGPLTPQLVEGWVAQTPSEWVTRAAFFVGIGQVAAVLVRPSLPSLGAQLQRLRLDRALRRAIAHDDLLLHYQPIVSLPTGELAGVEVLVRWDDPADGIVPASRFMPLAETCPVIHDLGAMVLARACAQAARWEAAFGPARAPYVSVNLSAAELDAPDLIERVELALAGSGLDPRRLCLEVTESALIEDFEGSVERLRQLKQLGVSIAIDDFGTGYSSLSYVHRFPADVLKIDRCFVEELETNPQSEAVIGGLVLLGRSLGLRVIAEGVETESQVARLGDLGCSHFQGYYYARPSPAAVIDDLLRSGGRLTVHEPARRSAQPAPEMAPSGSQPPPG